MEDRPMCTNWRLIALLGLLAAIWGLTPAQTVGDVQRQDGSDSPTQVIDEQVIDEVRTTQLAHRYHWRPYGHRYYYHRPYYHYRPHYRFYRPYYHYRPHYYRPYRYRPYYRHYHYRPGYGYGVSFYWG